jgi:hypothetical protein
MYLGTLYIFTKFRPDRISNMAILENPITLELMTGSSPNFYNRYVL